MNIRAIKKSEIDSLKNLWESLNAHHLSMSTHFKDYYARFTFRKRMNILKRRDRFIAYVAQDNGESIGYCIASVDHFVGEIDSIFIRAEHRGRGVGTALMTRSIQWLEEQKCKNIRVAIAEGNENAIGFYRRFGFAERTIVMQRNG